MRQLPQRDCLLFASDDASSVNAGWLYLRKYKPEAIDLRSLEKTKCRVRFKEWCKYRLDTLLERAADHSTQSTKSSRIL